MNIGWNNYEIGKDLNAPPGKSITALSRLGREHMEVMWVTDNGSIHDAYFDEKQQPAWKHYELAPPGSASGGITAVTRTPDHMEVWWVSATGSVEGSYWYDAEGRWTRYQLALPGSASPTSALYAQSRNSTNWNVWWIGPEGSVEGCRSSETPGYKRYQIAGDGSGALNSTLTAVARIPTSEEMWWQSPQGTVEGAKCDWNENPDGAWHRYQVVTANSVAIGSGMKAVSRVPDVIDLYWINPYGAVQECFFNDASSRVISEIALSGSADLKSGMTGVSRKSNTETLWWVSPKGEVIVQYWYDGYQKWRSKVLAPAGSASTDSQLASVSRDKGYMEIWFPTPSGVLVDWYCYQNIPPPMTERVFRTKFKLYLLNTIIGEGKDRLNFYTDKWKGVYLIVDSPTNTTFVNEGQPYGKFLAENPDEGTISFGGGLPSPPGTTITLGGPDGNGSYTTGVADGVHFGGYGDPGWLQVDSPWQRTDLPGQKITEMFDDAYNSGICPNGIYEPWQTTGGLSGQFLQSIGDFTRQLQIGTALITMRIIDVGKYQEKDRADQENANPPDGIIRNDGPLK